MRPSSGATRGNSRSSTTRKRLPESRRPYSISSVVHQPLRPTAIPPSEVAANSAISQSGEL